MQTRIFINQNKIEWTTGKLITLNEFDCSEICMTKNCSTGRNDNIKLSVNYYFHTLIVSILISFSTSRIILI